MKLRIGEVYRYPRLSGAKREMQSKGHIEPRVDGLPNLLSITAAPDGTLSQLERGINPLAKVGKGAERRVPAILISSSPHKAGSVTTPWQDHFDPDIGHARYFGDAKPGQTKPAADTPGNKAMLDQQLLHASSFREERLRAAPIVFFEATPHDGRTKGQRRFEGFGLVSGVDRVVQRASKGTASFVNYRFDCAILDMSAEGETFDWNWINARRDGSLTAEETLVLAPESWRRWVDGGDRVLGRVRRRVASLRTIKRADQMPVPGSRLDHTLNEIYKYYDSRKHRFEALAEVVTRHVVAGASADYRLGWITPPSSDGGSDFVGRLDVGRGLARAKLVVLGQAKCVKPTSSIGGQDIARVVARLRRGWLGAFVTTGHFSEAAQREVIEDRYPLMMINGLLLAEVVSKLLHEGKGRVHDLLDDIDSTYDMRVRPGFPEEIQLET